MERKVYEFDSGTIDVMLPKSYDREALKLATAEFLKKVFNGGTRHGDLNTSGNFK